jgi:hypothetical protein
MTWKDEMKIKLAKEDFECTRMNKIGGWGSCRKSEFMPALVLGTQLQPDSARKRSRNLRETYQLPSVQ